MSEVLRIERRGSVLDLCLNRPEKRNALDEALIAELTRALREDTAQDGVRVVVLRGEGKVFCAGADIEYMRRLAEADAETNASDARKLAELFTALSGCVRPVIAQVHGAAIGGGLGLVAASDLAVSTADAKFGFTETRLGIVPGVISPFALRRLGPAVCRRLFLTAEIFDGREAYRLGLVDHIASPDALEAEVAHEARQLRVGGPEAQRAAKSLLDEIDGLSLAEAIERTPAHIARQRATEEAAEGFAAFFAKRPPGWVVEEDS